MFRNNLTGGFTFVHEAYNRWMIDRRAAIVNVITNIRHGLPELARRHPNIGDLKQPSCGCVVSRSTWALNAALPFCHR